VSGAGSVTHWIRRLAASDQDACQKFWEGYFRRLVGLARKRLRGAPRAADDEEDVALSAFDSFCRRAREGRFPRLLDRHDLWQLLVLIARRKAANLAQHERRQKRGGGQVCHASALPSGDGSEAGALFADLIGREPEPALAAQVAEEFAHRGRPTSAGRSGGCPPGTARRRPRPAPGGYRPKPFPRGAPAPPGRGRPPAGSS
jgi:hypothetical protein